MTHKLTVKEHLGNAALYQPLVVAPYSSEWKHRLLNQYSINKQLNDVLYTKTSIIKMPACIILPIICLLFVFTSYSGFLPLGQWYENIISKDVLNLPAIGLKEILVFAAVINGVTFLSMKNKFSF
jgi:hypothetical protein